MIGGCAGWRGPAISRGFKHAALFSCLLVTLCGLALPGTWSEAADYAIGADLSFLKQAEDRGTVFKDGGTGQARASDLQGSRV